MYCKTLKAIAGILKAADWYKYGGHTAVLLLAGTGAVESNFGEHKRQVVQYHPTIYGKARGFFQMEPRTLRDIYTNFLAYRQNLREDISFLTGITSPNIHALEHNFTYQILLARVHYLRFEEALPEVVPVELGRYWKKYYNTVEGKGTIRNFIKKYHEYIGE